MKNTRYNERNATISLIRMHDWSNPRELDGMSQDQLDEYLGELLDAIDPYCELV